MPAIRPSLGHPSARRPRASRVLSALVHGGLISTTTFPRRPAHIPAFRSVNQDLTRARAARGVGSTSTVPPSARPDLASSATHAGVVLVEASKSRTPAFANAAL